MNKFNLALTVAGHLIYKSSISYNLVICFRNTRCNGSGYLWSKPLGSGALPGPYRQFVCHHICCLPQFIAKKVSLKTSRLQLNAMRQQRYCFLVQYLTSLISPINTSCLSSAGAQPVSRASQWCVCHSPAYGTNSFVSVLDYHHFCAIFGSDRCPRIWPGVSFDHSGFFARKRVSMYWTVGGFKEEYSLVFLSYLSFSCKTAWWDVMIPPFLVLLWIYALLGLHGSKNRVCFFLLVRLILCRPKYK